MGLETAGRVSVIAKPIPFLLMDLEPGGLCEMEHPSGGDSVVVFLMRISMAAYVGICRIVVVL